MKSVDPGTEQGAGNRVDSGAAGFQDTGLQDNPAGPFAPELDADLARLKQEHRDLDLAIGALNASGSADVLQVQRLKKRKLHLKDRIIHLEDELTPDIIA